MWVKGSVSPIWNEDYKKFKYTKKPFPCEETEMCKLQGYTHPEHQQYCSMYGSENPMPDWCTLVSNSIGLTNCGYNFSKMITGEYMAQHVDHFNTYCRIFNVDRENVKRAVVFLEDWKSGHYFDIDDQAICNYKKGDFVLWSSDVLHKAGNIGLDDRYTLQITGIMQ